VRFLRHVCAAVVGAALIAGSARCQDPAAREEQIQRIRQLPADEKQHLKEALARFNALPETEREALRAKARAVGADRLGELAGRDYAKLKQKHAFVERETDEVLKDLGGPERFAGLTPDERAYVRDMAMRNFQRYCSQRLLESAGLDAGYDKLPPAAKRERGAKAAAAAVQQILDEKTPEEKAAYAAMTPAEQKRERGKAMVEWRLRRTTEFAKRFDNFRLLKIIDMPPEERHKLLANQVRWYQIMTLLHTEGVDKDTLKMLGQLRADERAQVAHVWEQSEDQTPADRMAKVKDKIHELYGASTFDEARLRTPAPRLPEILRERARRERERLPIGMPTLPPAPPGQPAQPAPPRDK
jgi:hypothetical protein